MLKIFHLYTLGWCVLPCLRGTYAVDLTFLSNALTKIKPFTAFIFQRTLRGPLSTSKPEFLLCRG